MSDSTAIRGVNLGRSFEAGEVVALDSLSLEVSRGESLAIVGPSGSGKTTLLNLLGLLDRPTAGELVIAGHRVGPKTDLDRLRAQEIGFIFQLHNLIPTLTAQENVEIPMMALATPAAERRARAAELLELVGLADRMSFRTPKLSGGERQRVAVVRALANRPRILLADEPTGNLDSATGRETIDLLLQLPADHGLTLLLVTHDSEVAARMERRIELRDGRVVADSLNPDPA